MGGVIHRFGALANRMGVVIHHSGVVENRIGGLANRAGAVNDRMGALANRDGVVENRKKGGFHPFHRVWPVSSGQRHPVLLVWRGFRRLGRRAWGLGEATFVESTVKSEEKHTAGTGNCSGGLFVEQICLTAPAQDLTCGHGSFTRFPESCQRRQNSRARNHH
jgi:hypothetical protein